jgi:predicted metal-dependent hydrolase
MPTIELDGQNVTYTLLLDKRRKNIQLRILPTAVIEIVTPGKLAALDIEHIIASKSTWIKRRLSKLASLAENPVNQQVACGSQLLYLGEPHTLALLPGSPKIEVTATDGELRVILPQSLLEQVQSGTVLQKIIKAWLVDQAGKLLHAKTKEWAAIIGVSPKKITIRDQKSRWGSCSSLGSINYNWRVIMAPLWVTDYLVIHELCHMLVPNHSSAFWEQVGRFCPNYKECRKWLTDNGKLLSRLF